MRRAIKHGRNSLYSFGVLGLVLLSFAGVVLDPHEVTNREFLQFVQKSGHPPPEHWANGRYPDGQGEEPVVLVTWHEAVAYCKWAGEKRLPTVDEWLKSCQSGTLEKKGDVWEWTSTEVSTDSGIFMALCGPRDTCDCSHQYLPGWKNSVKGFRCSETRLSLTSASLFSIGSSQ